MSFREKIKRVFARSPAASKDGNNAVEEVESENKKPKTVAVKPAAVKPVKPATATAVPRPKLAKLPPPPAPIPAPIPAPSTAAAPKSKLKKTLKPPFPQPIPKLKAKKTPQTAQEGVAAVRAKFANVTPRKPKYDKNGKPKIELYKPYEVPPSKYRGPFDQKHLKKLADYSWGQAMTERPRSLVSQCSPMTEAGLGGKPVFWAGDNGNSGSTTKVGEQGRAGLPNQDKPFGSISQLTGAFPSDPFAKKNNPPETETDLFSLTRDEEPEMTFSSSAQTSTHDGTDRDTLGTCITVYTDRSEADEEDEEEEEGGNFLLLTESHIRIFDSPTTPLSPISRASTNPFKESATPLTEPDLNMTLSSVKELS